MSNALFILLTLLRNFSCRLNFMVSDFVVRTVRTNGKKNAFSLFGFEEHCKI